LDFGIFRGPSALFHNNILSINSKHKNYSLVNIQGNPVSKRTKTQEILDSRDSSNWNEVEFEEWKLPGTEEPHDWCGNWVWKGCMYSLDHHAEHKGKIFVKHFQRSCYRASCQECVLKWISREANAVTRRLEKGLKQSKRKHVIHVIVSPPSWVHNRPYSQLRKTSYAIAKSVGVEGGASIFHPFRFRKENNSWYYSPHFHLMVVGWIKDTKELYNKNGWIVKNLGIRKNMGEVFGTVHYQLSHTGVKKKVKSVTWFGKFTYSKLRIEKTDEKEKCPDCARPLQRLDYTLVDWKLLDGTPPNENFESFVDPIGWERVSTNYDFGN